MRFKEIIRNKWGWVFGIIFLIIGTFSLVVAGAASILGGASDPNIYFKILTFGFTLGQILAKPLGSLILLSNILPFVFQLIYGFAIGMLVQYSWRKFK